ncbi:response regulator transcription factor [Amycolatopsis sp. NPDC026612]|uniref:response regulator transcription factor n=1 Tax=Amycolatopsis sp. NPDC026612 TaxID=3155466 RepID=UPI0033EE54B4
MTVKVVIADDQALVRGGFRILVDSAPDLTVVGEAGDGAEAVNVIRRERPDVALMDIRMPVLDGIEATRRLLTGTGDLKIIILTTFNLDKYVFSALRAGASGFLLKDTPPADLLTAIRVVAAGDALLSPTVTRRLIEEFTQRPEPVIRHLDGITAREREILLLVGRGLTNAEITAALHLSMSTVKTHVSRLLTKLQARDRTQLVIAAYESGLVTARAG